MRIPNRMWEIPCGYMKEPVTRTVNVKLSVDEDTQKVSYKVFVWDDEKDEEYNCPDRTFTTDEFGEARGFIEAFIFAGKLTQVIDDAGDVTPKISAWIEGYSPAYVEPEDVGQPKPEDTESIVLKGLDGLQVIVSDFDQANKMIWLWAVQVKDSQVHPIEYEIAYTGSLQERQIDSGTYPMRHLEYPDLWQHIVEMEE